MFVKIRIQIYPPPRILQIFGQKSEVGGDFLGFFKEIKEIKEIKEVS